MKPLRSRPEVDEILATAALAVLYKHSGRCPVSLDAYTEMQTFALAHPEVPVYLVDVIADRPVSQYVAERTGTVHQSPQAIVWQNGQCAWAGSHYAITARELAGWVGRAT